MQRPTEGLPERGVGELLNQTLIIYGRHLWRLIAMAAAVQIPVNIVSLVVGLGMVGYFVSVLLGAFGSVFVYGMVSCAVGQHYAAGVVNVRRCFDMVWGRIVSLLVLTMVTALLLTAVIGPAPTDSASATVGVVLLVALPVVLALVVYWSASIQTVVLERYRGFGALKRSFGLVKGSWWRVFGIMFVMGLVGVGLGLVLILPVGIVMGILAPDPATALSNSLQLISTLIVMSAVFPLISIGGTLLYLDLRVRKEGFNLERLSQEMGVTQGSARV